MQQPPSISTNLFNALDSTTQRLTVLVEFYENDVLPGVDGFDPDDAILRITNISDADGVGKVSFLGNDYDRYLAKAPGKINRTITEKFNSVNIVLTNPEEPPASGTRPMAAFILSNPIEGMYLVVRVIPRSFTPTTLADSFIYFTGKIEKLDSVDTDNQTLTLAAKQYFGSVVEETPWRQLDTEDERGVAQDDPLFEGFPFRPISRLLIFETRVRRGGFAGLIGLKKTVQNTIQSSTQSGDIKRYVPLILGRAQVQFIPVAWIDEGDQLNVIYNISEGAIREIFDPRCVTQGFRFASVNDSNPEIDQFRYGYPGGTNGQVPFLDNLTGGIPGNGFYSRSAMMSTAFYGTEVSQEDPAPDVIAVIMGMIMPIPDSSGDFILEQWTDNPAFITRWLLTHDRTFNIDPAFIDDPQCIKTACYCDDPVLDETNGELILLPSSESTRYGTLYRRYHSTSLFTPEYFKHYFLDQGQDPLPELTLPTVDSGLVTFFDPAGAIPELDILPLVRRRFSTNINLTEKMKLPDFLHKVVLPTFRGFVTFNAKGKIGIKARRPGDNTVIRTASLVDATEIAVNSILAWLSSTAGKVIVGNDLLTSEIRSVTSARYTTAANSITLAVTGNLTASGATLSGGTNGPPGTPATGTITVTGLGTLTVTIEGHAVSYTTQDADTTSTAAAMLSQFLKADTTFQSFLKFTWDPDTPTVISIASKIGFLVLGSALANTHSLAEEVLRIQMAFADGLSTPADLLNSNIIKGSFSWPMGSRSVLTNRIDSTYIDAPQDFAAQPLRTRDQAHIDQVKKVLPEEITLTGVDNFHQAKRLQNSALAELRDLDHFHQVTSDRRALLLEEGDLIANTHASGGFRNVAIRAEEVTLDLEDFKVTIIGRRYSTSAYSDEAPQRNVPLPTTLLGDAGPPTITFNTTDFLPFGLIQTTDSESITSVRGGMIFGASVFTQKAKVFLKRPNEATFTQIDTKEPDANLKAIFEFIASEEGTYTVKLQVCYPGDNCNPTQPQAQITVAFGALGAMLTQEGGIMLTQGGDFMAT